MTNILLTHLDIEGLGVQIGIAGNGMERGAVGVSCSIVVSGVQ